MQSIMKFFLTMMKIYADGENLDKNIVTWFWKIKLYYLRKLKMGEGPE